MKSQNILATVIIVGSFAVVGSVDLAAQQTMPSTMPTPTPESSMPAAASASWRDRFTLKALNGVAFSEMRGYETWPDVAVSETEGALKVIVGNHVMIKAYRDGIPGNGKPFPDGAKIVKIEWSKRTNAVSPYPVREPDTLKSVAFIQKDSKRFPDTSGWGYAQFFYDVASDTVKPYGTDSTFGKVCYGCHTIQKSKDYIFTSYPRR